MRKISAVLAVVVMVVSLASLAFAGSDYQTVVLKSVDETAGTMVYTTKDGKDVTVKVDKDVSFKRVKVGKDVMIMVENDMVTKMRPAKSKAAVGC